MCAIVGIYGNEDASKLASAALFAMQHRGHEATGISTASATNANINSTTTIGTNVSSTITGTQFSIRATTVNTLFGSNSTLVSTLTVVGLDSGARITVPITITKSTT